MWYEELKKNASKHQGESFHFVFKRWDKPLAGRHLWSVITYINGEEKHWEYDFFGVERGVAEYLKSRPNSPIYVYRFDRKSKSFKTKRKVNNEVNLVGGKLLVNILRHQDREDWFCPICYTPVRIKPEHNKKGWFDEYCTGCDAHIDKESHVVTKPIY